MVPVFMNLPQVATYSTSTPSTLYVTLPGGVSTAGSTAEEDVLSFFSCFLSFLVSFFLTNLILMDSLTTNFLQILLIQLRKK